MVWDGSPHQTSTDLALASGHIDAGYAVNKFGRNTNVDTGSAQDIWDGGGIWVAPTQARIHQFSSSSADDSSGGTGLQVCKFYGLADWDSEESSEFIIMDGEGDVPTVMEYVIIQRIEPISWGSAGPNVGIITATADTDGTVTAQILAGKGQTQMAIYGVPSGYNAYMSQFYRSMNAGTAATTKATFELVYNPIPQITLTGFVVKHADSINSDQANPGPHQFRPWKTFSGPGIIKMRAITDKNDTDVSAGFDLMMVKK